MDFKSIIAVVLFISTATATIVDNAASPPNNKNATFGQETTKNGLLTSNPPGSYQVTEHVIDIPDNRTPRGPIDPSYAIYIPLNIVNVNNNKVKENNAGEAENETKNKHKNNKFSILHIKAEYDEKPEAIPTGEGNSFHKVVKGFKDYVYGLKKGLINGIHTIFHRKNENEEFDFEKPSFHDKFHKSFDETDKFFDDNDDNDFSHEFDEH